MPWYVGEAAAKFFPSDTVGMTPYSTRRTFRFNPEAIPVPKLPDDAESMVHELAGISLNILLVEEVLPAGTIYRRERYAPALVTANRKERSACGR